MYHEKDKTLCSTFTGRGAGLGFVHRLRRSRTTSVCHWQGIRRLFVEQINSKRPGKPVQKVDVKHSDMMVALAKISEDGKFKARDGGDHEANGCGFGESWYWMILSDPIALNVSGESTVEAVKLTPENLTQYGPAYFVDKKQLSRIDEYDIVTRVMDDKTYVAVYLHLEEAKS
jgi:hypothetical protein